MARRTLANRTSRTASPVFLVIFALGWTAFSLFFVFMGVRGFDNEKSSRDWDVVPCQIERFEIRDQKKDHDPFTIDLEFRYFHSGTERSGTKLHAEEKRFATYTELVELRAELMAGPNAQCRVNPADPNDAILISESDNSLLGKVIFGVFGGAFACIGIGLLIFSLKGMREAKKIKAGVGSITAAAAGNKEGSAWIMVPFFGIFALAGLGVAIGVAGPMWKNYFAARSWVEAPGEVIWSKVRSHSGDSTTYSTQIFYRYTYQDKNYKSDRTTLLKGSSSGRKSKEEMVKNHPRGKQITVWVNPQKPSEAILDRSFGHWAWFTLFPLPFMAVGFGGLYFTLRKRGKSPSHSADTGTPPTHRPFSNSPSTPNLPAGQSLRLTPGTGRLYKVIGTLIFAAIWNGLTSVFVIHVVDEWQTKNPPWGLTLFLIPFVLVGLATFGGLLYQLGALFNPRPVVDITPGTLGIGQSLSVRWEVPSGSGRLRDLRILLRGEEVATSQNGKNSRTSRSTFFEREIGRAETPETIAMGRGSLRLPDDMVPSWTASNNRIEWTIEVHATIPFWPDIKDSHVVQVRSTT